MNAACRFRSNGKAERPKLSTAPLYVRDLGELDKLKREGRIMWVGNKMKALVDDHRDGCPAELRPIRMQPVTLRR